MVRICRKTKRTSAPRIVVFYSPMAYLRSRGIFDGILYTHPDSNLILPGITRAIVLESCQEFDIPVGMFPILENKLPNIDEMMILGTGSEVMPVVEIDGWQVRNGKPGLLPCSFRTHISKAILWTLFDLKGLCKSIGYVTHCFLNQS